jgi:tetratricopeptide (TPR) repeat protein
VWQWTIGVAFVLLLLGVWSQYEAAHPPCELAEDIAELADSPEWAAFSAQAAPGTTRHFEVRMDAMIVDARQSCRIGDDAMQQHLASTLQSLDSLIAQPSAAGWEQRVELFEQDFLARASVPMSDPSYDLLLTELQPLEDEWDLKKLLGKCDELLRAELSDIDRAAFLLRCARAKSIEGEHDDAIDDFRTGRHLAGKQGDKQRSLTAALWLARTYLTRKQSYEVGEMLLENVRNLFAELHATAVFDRRWADHDELFALWLAFGQQRTDEAVVLQRRVVARQLLFGETETRVRALVNLGAFEQLSGAPRRAAIAYRMALELEPDDPEALLDYALLLSNESADPGETRTKLNKLLADPDHDLHLAAMTVLLGLSIESSVLPRIDAEQRQLAAMLLDEQVPRTPTHESEAWMAVNVALFLLGERGAALDEAASHLSDDQLEFIRQLSADSTNPQQPSTP